MIAACYSMDLYCENADGPTPICPTGWHNFPHTYTGETWGECVRQARKDGWKITRDREAFCPDCSGKKRPKK